MAAFNLWRPNLVKCLPHVSNIEVGLESCDSRLSQWCVVSTGRALNVAAIVTELVEASLAE